MSSIVKATKSRLNKSRMKERRFNKLSGVDAARFLISSGYLWYLNKVVFHLLGWKLIVEVNERSDTFTIHLEDHRMYPAIIFSDSEFQEGQEKFDLYMQQYGTDVVRHRKRILGYTIQKKSHSLPSTTSQTA